MFGQIQFIVPFIKPQLLQEMYVTNVVPENHGLTVDKQSQTCIYQKVKRKTLILLSFKLNEATFRHDRDLVNHPCRGSLVAHKIVSYVTFGTKTWVLPTKRNSNLVEKCHEEDFKNYSRLRAIKVLVVCQLHRRCVRMCLVHELGQNSMKYA